MQKKKKKKKGYGNCRQTPGTLALRKTIIEEEILSYRKM